MSGSPTTPIPPPTPKAVRLLRAQALASTRLPTPPFAMAAWSDDPRAALVVVSSEDETVGALLPDASTLSPGTLVILPIEVGTPGGLFARLRPAPRLSREARASALLARGYVDIAANLDVVWAYSPLD